MIPIIAALFRAKWLIVVVFVLVFSAVAALVKVLPKKYEAHMKLLVKNERADPLVSPGPHEMPTSRVDVTEEEINSELQLLNSTELLAGVVRQTGLYKEFKGTGSYSQEESIERAVRKLSKDLKITPVRKASVIEIAYSSKDGNLSANVLSALADLFLEEHLQVHRSRGAYEFFKNQTAAYRGQLQQTEDHLNGFVQAKGLTLLAEQKELTLRRVIEIQQARDEAGAALAENTNRIDSVNEQSKSTPSRTATQNRITANQYSVERLHTMLAELQNRKTQLDAKFRSDDWMVVEAQKEIDDTRAALDQAKNLRSTEEATDVNPLRQSLDSELMRLQQAHSGLTARKQNLDEQLLAAHRSLARLESNSVEHNDLQRQLKEAEEKYLLYATKQEEARISDSLDQQKISNVVVAERPIVPSLPAPSNVNLLLGTALAAFVSVGAGLMSQLSSRKLHTPSGFELLTELPVLATVPMTRRPMLSRPMLTR